MRFTDRDVDALCDQFMSSGSKGDCLGCKLHEQLLKPVAKRSKTFLTRLEPRVKKLRDSRP